MVFLNEKIRDSILLTRKLAVFGSYCFFAPGVKISVKGFYIKLGEICPKCWLDRNQQRLNEYSGFGSNCQVKPVPLSTSLYSPSFNRDSQIGLLCRLFGQKYSSLQLHHESVL